MLVTMETVRENIRAGADVTLIDSREPKRYAGVEELVDHKAGHIPTAVNHFWKDGMLQSGQFKNGAGQQERFQNLSKDKETIVYCGSGVTACPNIVALKLAGFQNVKLYAGSWSDWISYPENQIAKKKINHLHAKIICIKIRSQARDCSKNFVFYTLETM